MRRPEWIGHLIQAVATEADPACVGDAAACALEGSRWREGKEVFNRVRAQRLLVLNTPGEVRLALAEAACAVAYNATGPPDRYDDDWGWIAAGCALQLADGRRAVLERLAELGVRRDQSDRG